MTSTQRRRCDRRTALGLIGCAALSVVAPKRAIAKVAPIDSGSWMMAVLPDTQYYAQTWPMHFDAQTTWIAEHGRSHNIRFVLHEGDITNANVKPQWDNALHSMNFLNGVVPYSMVTGNHDCGPHGTSTDRQTYFNDRRYFGPGSPYAKQSTIGEFYESDKTENSFHTFRAGERDWLVLALEWAPRDAVIDWANKVVEGHPNHLTILVTHAYMYHDDTRYDWNQKHEKQGWNPHSFGMMKQSGETANDGQQLWDKLVVRHKNFRFTFNGHVIGDGTGYLSSKGQHGNVVHQMLANYQFKHEGGDGDMRLIEFKNDCNDLIVRTYSPVLDRYDLAPDQQFALKMDEPYVMPPSAKKRSHGRHSGKSL